MSGSLKWLSAQNAFDRKNAALEIHDRIVTGIMAGELTVGEKLPAEQKMATAFGVSRPVVREALRSVEALGLTRTRSGSGTFVVAEKPSVPSTFDRFSVTDLLEARPGIEVPAARLAARRRTQEQASQLMSLCDQMSAEERPEAWVVLDSEFHAGIAKASQNAIFAQVVTDLRKALSQQSKIINLLVHRRVPSNEEHLLIAAAIQDKNESLAADLMEQHLAKVENVVADFLA